jgi:hypothetical protein
MRNKNDLNDNENHEDRDGKIKPVHTRRKKDGYDRGDQGTECDFEHGLIFLLGEIKKCKNTTR